MKPLSTYKNEDIKESVFNNESKIESTKDSESNFPLNIDLCITHKCDGGCPYCYINASKENKHADLNQEFIDTLNPLTKVNINGNDLTHPDLIDFLKKLKSKNIICNMTVSQKHFMRYTDLLRYLINTELIKGLGISFNKRDYEFLKEIKTFKNVTIYAVSGIISPLDIEFIANNDLKLLILGYKKTGRGYDFYIKNQESIFLKQSYIINNLKNLMDKFKVLSFDNLAMKQLDVKNILAGTKWMDSLIVNAESNSMFIDMVNKKFQINSAEKEVSLDVTNNINDMFKTIKEQERSNKERKVKHAKGYTKH